jgi:hypothetical protein
MELATYPEDVEGGTLNVIVPVPFLISMLLPRYKDLASVPVNGEIDNPYEAPVGGAHVLIFNPVDSVVSGVMSIPLNDDLFFATTEISGMSYSYPHSDIVTTAVHRKERALGELKVLPVFDFACIANIPEESPSIRVIDGALVVLHPKAVKRLLWHLEITELP